MAAKRRDHVEELAMIIWVKYGFKTTPLKPYNMNVSSAILLSFLKMTCIKDIDDYCKQKTIQLSVELDAIRRSTHRKSVPTTGPPAASSGDSAPGSRPPSGNTSAASPSLEQPRPKTPSTTRRESNATSSLEDHSDEATAIKAKKELLEKQLDTVNAAARLVKELAAGTSWVDLVDENGARMNLDTAGNTRVNMLVTARQQYSAVSVTQTIYGDIKVAPLVLTLPSQ